MIVVGYGKRRDREGEDGDVQMMPSRSLMMMSVEAVEVKGERVASRSTSRPRARSSCLYEHLFSSG